MREDALAPPWLRHGRKDFPTLRAWREAPEIGFRPPGTTQRRDPSSEIERATECGGGAMVARCRQEWAWLPLSRLGRKEVEAVEDVAEPADAAPGPNGLAEEMLLRSPIRVALHSSEWPGMPSWLSGTGREESSK